MTPTPDEDGITLIGEKGKIYLIPNAGTENQNVYDEFVWTNNTWEKIGTTKVDLSDYVTNSSLTTTLAGYVTTANYNIKIGELEEAISNAKPENYISTVSDGKTDAEGNYVNVTSGETKLVIKDGREEVHDNDLWGTTVTLADGVITVDHKYLSNPNVSSAWLSNVKAVQDNKAYSEITTDSDGKFTGVVDDSVVANLQTDMLKDGSFLFYYSDSRVKSPLCHFDGDLSNLVESYAMFENASLTSFDNELPKLKDGERMFYGT